MAFTLAAAPSSPATSGGFRVPTTGTAATPTIPTTIKTLPNGGAYNEGAPGQTINTGHTSYAGMPAKQGFQRNDIIPVSLGGSNQSGANLEYEPEKEAVYRDNVEKYYANQVKSGAVPLNAARVAVLGWKDTDIPNQPAYNKQFGGPLNTFSNALRSSPEAITNIYHGAVDAWDKASANVDPKSFSNLGEATLNKGADALGGVLTDYWSRMQNMTDTFISNAHTTALQKGVSVGEAGVGALNVLFSVFTVPLKAVSGLPGVGQVADKINEAFSALQGGSNVEFNQALDGLPISDETKAQIKPLGDELTGLVNMFAAGKVGGDVLGKITDLSKQIVTKAVVDAPKDAPQPTEAAPVAPQTTPEQPSVAPETPAEAPAVTPETPVAPVEEPKLGYTKTIEPKAAPTPDEQLPTIQMNKPIRSGGVQNLKPIKGTGELKTRGTFSTLEAAAIQKDLTEGFSGFPTFKGADFKKISEGVIKNIAKDPEGAMKIAMGEKGAPAGSIPEMYYNVLSKKAIAEGDVATIQKLATESKLSAGATTMGQRLAALGYQKDAFDPVAAIKEVQDARAVELAKKSTETVELVTKTITKTIRARNTKASWGDFVDSITC